MAKNIIIASESPELYTTRRLIEEGNKLKRSTKWLNPYSESINLSKNIKNSNGLYFFRTTGVRYDDFDLTYAKNLSMHGLKITNSLASLQNFRSKDIQQLFFLQNKFNSIPTFLYRGILTPAILNEIQMLSKDELYILKMNRGNQGLGVNLINGHQSLKSILETFHALKDQKFIIQPYIPHTKELRIFMIKNEIQAVVEKTITKNDFRGNAKRSNAKLLTTLPKALVAEIQRAGQLSGLDYCGIDLLLTAKSYYFLEINAVPGFEQIESLSKKNIARELITQLE